MFGFFIVISGGDIRDPLAFFLSYGDEIINGFSFYYAIKICSQVESSKNWKNPKVFRDLTLLTLFYTIINLKTSFHDYLFFSRWFEAKQLYTWSLGDSLATPVSTILGKIFSDWLDSKSNQKTNDKPLFSNPVNETTLTQGQKEEIIQEVAKRLSETKSPTHIATSIEKFREN